MKCVVWVFIDIEKSLAGWLMWCPRVLERWLLLLFSEVVRIVSLAIGLLTK